MIRWPPSVKWAHQVNRRPGPLNVFCWCELNTLCLFANVFCWCDWIISYLSANVLCWCDLTIIYYLRMCFVHTRPSTRHAAPGPLTVCAAPGTAPGPAPGPALDALHQAL